MFPIATRARWCVLFALGMFSPAFHVFAETENIPVCDPPIPATSESLLQTALNCNPGQQAIAARWQAQRHRIEVEGSLDDPRLVIGAAPDTFGDDRFDDGYIVELTQPLPWPGILSLREQVAAAEADVWQARVDRDRVVLARQVRLAFADWQYHHQLLDINRQHQQLWQEFVSVAHAKYAAGTGSKSAVLQATHESHLLMETTIELAAMIERDVSHLKQLVNLRPEAPLTAPASHALTPVTLPETAFATLLAAIDRQPDLRMVEARQQHKAGELALAEKNRYPNFSVMTRYNSLWMNDEQRWVVGVSINLPLDFGKRSSREESLRAEQTALRWEWQDELVRLREQLVQFHSFWRQADEVYSLYQQKLVPLAEESLITARNEYQSGAGDFLSLLITQRQTLTTRRKASKAERDRFVQFANLTAAAGLVHLSDWEVSRRQP